MKLNKWLFGAMAMAMLASCSDNDVVNSGKNPEDKGQGYVGINIQLPSVSSTRADGDDNLGSWNDQFDDGLSSEYAVNDASLMIFQVAKGGNEEDATYVGTFELQQGSMLPDEGADNGQITVKRRRVANVKGIDKTKDIYALVMVNGRATGVYGNNLEIAGITKGESTIVDLQYLVTKATLCNLNSTDAGSKGIFMTNSPLSPVKGGVNSPLKDAPNMDRLPVLVKLDAEKIYPTEDEAVTNPAGIIHVERAVAKVTCGEFLKDAEKVTVNGTTYLKTGLTVKADGKGDTNYELVVGNIEWAIDQVRNSSYLVRNTNRSSVKGGSDKLWRWYYATNDFDGKLNYRMVGHTGGLYDADDNEYYRPYFCQSPEYSKDRVADTDYLPTATATKWSASRAFYPRENTFPVSNMKYKNTTRVCFWLQFSLYDNEKKGLVAGNFYIKGKDKSTLYLDNKVMDDNGKAIALDPLTTQAINYLSANEKIQKHINKYLKDDGEGNKQMPENLIYRLFNFEVGTGEDGRLKFKSVSFIPEDPGDDKFHAAMAGVPSNWYDDDHHDAVFTEDLIADLNNLGDYYKYNEGKAFYEVRIKHFGDDLTPWKIGDTQSATDINEAYGSDKNKQENDYLGRYGIVRNNWYDLNVTSLSKLGDYEDPKIWNSDDWEDTPDDSKNQYIAVRLRVLSWAKRVQNVDF